MNEIKIKRVYDAADEHDGYRILADRLWPRGIAKVKADINQMHSLSFAENNSKRAM